MTRSEAGATIVRNRDIPKLQRIHYLMEDIESIEQRIQWQRDRMTSITQHLTGMPGGGGVPKGFDDAFASISEIEDRHRLMVKQYAREMKHAENIINGIRNENMRTFVRMMYLDNLPGSEVRERLNMTRRGFDYAKKIIEEAKNMSCVVWHDRYMT